MRNRGTPVLEMAPWADPVARLPFAVAKISVLEQVNRKPLLHKTLREGRESVITQTSKTVRHDDYRRFLCGIGEEKPSLTAKTAVHKR